MVLSELQKTRVLKFSALSVVALALSFIAFLLSAPFLRVLRKSFGALAYWSVGVIFVLALALLKMAPLALFMGTFWTTLGTYVEFERKGLSWKWSGTISIFAGCVLMALAAFIATKNFGIHVLGELEASANEVVNTIKSVNPKITLEPATLMQLVPAAIISLLVIALGVGLIFEGRVYHWFKLPRTRIASQLKLLDFRLPDFFIWVVLFSFLFSFQSFGNEGLKIVGTNALVISLVLYFFQGLAVMEFGLAFLRSGFFSRFLAYFVFLIQVPMLLSFIGLADYWIDFRKRMKKSMLSKINN